MKVLAITGGSHGDVHPFLGIGQELQRRGHDVHLFVHPYYEREVARAGLAMSPLSPEVDHEGLLKDPELMHPRKGGAKILKLLLQTGPAAIEQVRSYLKVDRPDVLVSHHICFGSRWLAEEFSIPCALVVLAPMMWFSARDPVPAVQRRSGWFFQQQARLLGSVLYPLMTWYGGRKLQGLRHAGGFGNERGLLLKAFRGGDANLGLFSPHLRPRYDDDPPQGTICGFPWFDGGDGDSPLDPILQQFLQAGERPIVFSLGTSVVHAPGDFYSVCVEACRSLGRRGVLLIGKSGRPPKDLPNGILAVPYAPFSQLLPYACAVVNHGGIGSVAQALRTGCPLLVVAHAHDQFNNGLRVQRRGVGRMIHRSALTAQSLEQALRQILEDPGVAQRSTQLAELMKDEDGARVAADVVEGLVYKGVRAR
jgi:UDP:flavonoid glycosyltransferase YjiC (YdhE family)